MRDFAASLVLPFAILGCAVPHGDGGLPLNTPERQPDVPPEPAPLPTEPWRPAVPEVEEAAGFAWSATELGSACALGAGAEVSAPPVRVVSNAKEFEAAFCRTAELDWSRFRVVTFLVQGHVVDLALSRTDEQYRVVATTRTSCDDFSDTPVHLLLPADALPVAVVRKPEPPPSCPEGYGY